MQKVFIIVDLFCGAGGTTTGFEQAELNGEKIAQVIACVNHDKYAIESHAENHPHTLHFFEDIKTVSMQKLSDHINEIRSIYPAAKLILHASLECTNFSKAKGGLPRDADSRTLAEHLFRYIDHVNYDYITIENVVEFMAWGELDKNGKPISKKKGADWLRWRNKVCSYGFVDEWRELNSADFGVGIYHSMSDKHLQQYIDEFVFRYNSRNCSENYRFDSMLNNINTHLSYKQLINARDNRKMENKQGSFGF